MTKVYLFNIMLPKKNVFFFVGIFLTGSIWSQNQPPSIDSLQPMVRELVSMPLIIEESPLMVKQNSPVAHSTLNGKDIQKLNNGQDLTYILRFTPSMVTTSDAGTGIGYTGLWIRGSDPSRINVTINHIPLNDAESQQVFWVNLPDLASSAQSIQIQRGAGPSTAGPGAFGGSIHINTLDQNLKEPRKISYQTSVGSFNTFRRTLQLDRIALPQDWYVSARFSEITSDGYIDRASAQLKGYQGTLQKNGRTKGWQWKVMLTAFGGNERTYQAWNGSPYEAVYGNGSTDLMEYIERNGLSAAEAQNLLNAGRTYNYYTYRNQVDQYQQHHQQAHFQISNDRCLWQSALFHTRGAGYFEEQKLGTSLNQYGIDSLATLSNGQVQYFQAADVVRRRWLDNQLSGIHTFFQYRFNSQHKIISGVTYQQYQGIHSGEIIDILPAPTTDYSAPYYHGEASKSDLNTFAQYHWRSDEIQSFIDLQYRQVNYHTLGTSNDLVSYDIKDQLHFFNPKIGATFQASPKHQMGVLLAHIGKEPNRNDYIDQTTLPRPEYMTDMELSWKYRPIKVIKENQSNGYDKHILEWNTHLYWMQYKDQLVLTGELNDVGAPLRMNIPNSFRRGIELESNYLWERDKHSVQLNANATFSQNKIENFEEVLYDYSVDYTIQKIQHTNTDIAFSPQQIIGGMLTYQWNKAWGIQTQWKHISQQYLDNTQDEEKILPAYQVQDVKLFYQWKGSKVNGEIALWTMNIWNQMYSANGWTYSYIYGSKINERFYYPQAGRNFMLSVKIELE
jgi:iron complex outermembrane recepter protein